MVELTVAYIIAVGLCAGMFALFEHKPITDSMWWAIVTATTTGYGDISPVTIGGRAIAIFLMHFVPFFVAPLVTGHIAARLIVDNDAFTHNEQEEIKTLLRRIDSKL